MFCSVYAGSDSCQNGMTRCPLTDCTCLGEYSTHSSTQMLLHSSYVLYSHWAATLCTLLTHTLTHLEEANQELRRVEKCLQREQSSPRLSRHGAGGCGTFIQSSLHTSIISAAFKWIVKLYLNLHDRIHTSVCRNPFFLSNTTVAMFNGVFMLLD